jgi:hypothetical protein
VQVIAENHEEVGDELRDFVRVCVDEGAKAEDDRVPFHEDSTAFFYLRRCLLRIRSMNHTNAIFTLTNMVRRK